MTPFKSLKFKSSLIEESIIRIKSISSSFKYIIKDWLFILFISLLSFIVYYISNLYLMIDQRKKETLLLETYYKTLKPVLNINNLKFLIQYSQITNLNKERTKHDLIDYIKNHNYTHNPSIYSVTNKKNVIGYINLFDLINEISGEEYLYSILYEDEEILSNRQLNNKHTIIKQYNITDDSSLLIRVQLNTFGASYKKHLSELEIKKELLFNSLIILIMIILLSRFFLLKQRNELFLKNQQLNRHLNEAKQRLDNLLAFKKQNKDFIIECYEYTKKIHSISLNPYNELEELDNNYLPLPLIVNDVRHDLRPADIIQLIKSLKSIYAGYKAVFDKRKIKLNIENKSTLLKVKFDKEVFYQLIISVFFNLLYFNRDEENIKYLNVDFHDDKITFSSDGFYLDHNLAMKYSETIFYETGNPYILSLKQVFILLKQFEITSKFTNTNQSTIIDIWFTTSVDSENPNNENPLNIIRFKQVKKR